MQPIQPMKNPGVATVLSFFVPGAGQMYNGQIGKGIAILCAIVVSYVMMFFLVGFVMLPIVWLYGIVDANKTAQRINANMAATLGSGAIRDQLTGGNA